MKPISYLFVITCFLIQLPACNNKHTDLNAYEFEKNILNDSIQIMDVRTQEEYFSGHIKNSFLANWNNQAEFIEKIKTLDKKKPVYIYSLCGRRSEVATDWMRANGFTAFNLIGGINVWKIAGLPIEHSDVVK